jgi:hypothetical protein
MPSAHGFSEMLCFYSAQDIALSGPVASMTVASTTKLNMTCVSLIFAMSKWLYFSGRFFWRAASAGFVEAAFASLRVYS